MEGRYSLSDEVIFEQIGCEQVILDDRGVYIPNETARVILESIVGNFSQTDIVDRMVERYEVSRELARADIDRCIELLSEKGIITANGSDLDR